MPDFQSKNNFKRLLYSTPFLLLFLIIFILFSSNVVGIARKAIEVRENKRLAEQKYLELLKQQENLSAEIQKLSTERGVEEIIREQYGLAKDGEGVIVILDQEESQASESEQKRPVLDFLKKVF